MADLPEPSRRRTPGPRKVSRAVREEEILNEAGRVFATRGFYAASMDEIADRAGVSKPLVYNYFGSKESLYFAYIARSGEALLSAMIAPGRTDDPPEARLRAGADAFFGFVEERRDGWGVLFSELGAAGAPFRREVLAVRRRVIETTRAVFEDVASANGPGTAATIELDALAHAFVGAGESLANWWLEHPEEPRDAMVARLVDVTWVGLCAGLTGAQT